MQRWYEGEGKSAHDVIASALLWLLVAEGGHMGPATLTELVATALSDGMALDSRPAGGIPEQTAPERGRGGASSRWWTSASSGFSRKAC